jgi:hypothetical protein
MKNPQTTAKKLSKCTSLYPIGATGCCALTLLWWLDLDYSDAEAILAVDRMIKAKVIDENCFVDWDKAVFFLTGKKIKKIEFKKISTISNITKKTIVKYEWDGLAHFVGVENGKIAFNSLKESPVTDNGKPTETREIELFGGNYE